MLWWASWEIFTNHHHLNSFRHQQSRAACKICGKNVGVSNLWETLFLCEGVSIFCRQQSSIVKVYVGLYHLPALPAFHRAELHMPTSLQSDRMADMLWSVEKKQQQKV